MKTTWMGTIKITNPDLLYNIQDSELSIDKKQKSHNFWIVALLYLFY